MPDWLRNRAPLILMAGLLLVSVVACGGGDLPVIVEAENRCADDGWPPPDSPFAERKLDSADPAESEEIAALRPQALTGIERQLRDMRELADCQQEHAQSALSLAMKHADQGEFEWAVEDAESALELAKEQGDAALAKRIACHLKLYRRRVKSIGS
jgi:hypothetical protein